MTTKTLKRRTRKRNSRPLQPLVRPLGLKEHRFVLTVKTHGSRRSAELAVLTALAVRKPDDCDVRFNIRSTPGQDHKEAWMAGARAGAETAFDALAKSFEKLKAAFRRNVDLTDAK